MSINSNFFPLFENVKSLITETQKYVVRNVNSAMTLAYFRIGKMIVEDEQQGNQRAEYAKETIAKLSTELNKEFGKGYSISNLEYMRSFYNIYQLRISQSLIGKFKNSSKSQSITKNLNIPFLLSWTHYIQLLKIKDDDERNFYEIEASANDWSVRELQRQYNAALFERLALSKDKIGVRQLVAKGQLIEKPADALKSHYVLEFLGLKEDSQYSENK